MPAVQLSSPNVAVDDSILPSTLGAVAVVATDASVASPDACSLPQPLVNASTHRAKTAHLTLANMSLPRSPEPKIRMTYCTIKVPNYKYQRSVLLTYSGIQY